MYALFCPLAIAVAGLGVSTAAPALADGRAPDHAAPLTEGLLLLQSVPGLIVADSTPAVPFAVLIFTAFMSGIPGELIQAA